MIELLLTRYFRNLHEAQIVMVRLWEHEHNVYEVLPQLSHVRDALAFRGNADHCLRGYHGDLSNLLVSRDEMIV